MYRLSYNLLFPPIVVAVVATASLTVVSLPPLPSLPPALNHNRHCHCENTPPLPPKTTLTHSHIYPLVCLPKLSVRAENYSSLFVCLFRCVCRCPHVRQTDGPPQITPEKRTVSSDQGRTNNNNNRRRRQTTTTQKEITPNIDNGGDDDNNNHPLSLHHTHTQNNR